MLEFNKWFFVLLANFLVLVYVLNLILFRPLIRLFRERRDAIDGSFHLAAELEKKKAESVQRMQGELSDARDKARDHYALLRNEGLQKQKEILNAAQEKALKMIEEAQEKLRKETADAREKLRAEVEKYSEEIVAKIVKV